MLERVTLAVAGNRHVADVLRLIVEGLRGEPWCALARIWLVEPPHSLRLAASAGRPDGGEDWDRVDGAFQRFAIGERKIGRIAESGEGVLILDVRQDRQWPVDLAWAERQRIRSFAGQPLRFRDEMLGVLGVFSRETLDEQAFAWLRVFASHAAIAIANARAFEDIEALRGRLEMENAYLREEVTEAAGGMLGESPAMQNLRRQAELVAPTEANVLIQGASGTGKELVARAIHAGSSRRAKPLVKVNCASIPSELFESEFFGHVRGAFTGALQERVGRFQLADQGTLFLDEAGEIPLGLQAKLLRVLQEGEFERVGEDRTRRVDVRVIAATNRNLESEVEAGRFRQDLYYRLSVFPIRTPSLKERMEDVPMLAQHFLRMAARRLPVPLPRLTEENLASLTSYDWPGNVRELQNVMERALILSRGGPLTFHFAPPRKVAAAGSPMTRAELRAAERESIAAALRRSGGKVYGPGGAAEVLGMKPTTLASRIRALGVTVRES